MESPPLSAEEPVSWEEGGGGLHRGPTHTDSTPLLTDATDKLRCQPTGTQGTGAENLL